MARDVNSQAFIPSFGVQRIAKQVFVTRCTITVGIPTKSLFLYARCLGVIMQVMACNFM